MANRQPRRRQKTFSANTGTSRIPTTWEERPLPAAEFGNGPILVSKLLVALNMAKSNNNARQLIQQGGVSIGPSRDRITDIASTVAVTAGMVVRVGRTVVRVQLT